MSKDVDGDSCTRCGASDLSPLEQSGHYWLKCDERVFGGYIRNHVPDS